MPNQGREVYEFGPFSLDRDERVLLRDGQPVPLQPKDFDMLLVLVENHGRVVEKDELMKRVWPETFVEEANLSHHVFTLRKALGEDRDEIRYIETVPRRGYRFGAPVTGRADHAVDSTTEEASPPPVVANGPPVIHDTRPDPSSRLRHWHQAGAPAAVVVAAVAAGYGGWMLKPTPSRSITRLAITMAPGDTFTIDGPSTALALSPQGARVVYAANRRLYLRSLDRLEATPIPGVEKPELASARGPFFSPMVSGSASGSRGSSRRSRSTAARPSACATWGRRRTAQPGRLTIPS
jgi:DNA-binding winged helix-turn-helix (wHTH) protein